MIQRILHIFGSISLLAVIYLINNGISVGNILEILHIYVRYDLPQWVSVICYIVAVVGYIGFLIILFSRLRPGEIRGQHIEQLDADNSG